MYTRFLCFRPTFHMNNYIYVFTLCTNMDPFDVAIRLAKFSSHAYSYFFI
jgi:hypothetical protein